MEKAKAQFESLNTKVLAMNPASVESHRNYSEKKGFSFPILSDPDGQTITAFMADKEDGKGVTRTVYALGTDGKIIFAERGQADYKEIMEVIKAD